MPRDINLLHPKAKELADKLKAECDKAGLPILITETWRTKAEQDGLYAQGRTKSGKIVTNAKYPQSQHCWGTAFDFCKNVKGQEFSDSSFFTKVGKIAKSIGLEWGGDWKFVDKPHLQLPGTEYAWRTLQTKYGTPEKYKATWAKADTTKETTPMTTERNEAAIAEAKTIIGKLGKVIEISDVDTAVLQLADNYNNSVWWILKKLADKS